ncbi:hypothetical protein ACTA71_003035 [Dictyostelium dimigraforme]
MSTQPPVTTTNQQPTSSVVNETTTTTTAPQQPQKVLTNEEIKIKSFIDSLNLTFPFKWELEYHELISKGCKNNPVIPLIVISVDRMLSKEERSTIPNSFENNYRIQMEYVMKLDPNDESVQKELQEEQNLIRNAEGGDATMGEEEFEEFEEDESDDNEEND